MTDTPRRIGLTGGIGTGKSFILEALRTAGIPTLDADEVSRVVVRRGEPAYAAVVEAFGPGVVGPDGELDRTALARRVFNDAADRQRLERIVHPAVWREVDRFFRQAAGPAVAEVPLLFESGRSGDFDRILVTDCGPDLQVSRVAARGGVTEPDIRARIAAQMPAAERRRRADAVIETGGTREETLAQLRRAWVAWGLPPLTGREHP